MAVQYVVSGSFYILSRALAVTVSSIILLVLLITALISNFFKKDESTPDSPPTNGDECCSTDVKYFANKYDCHCEEHYVTTEDGHILCMYRIYSKKKMNFNLPPVILQHGLFQSSGIFITNEKESLAFVLAENGYDVWLGNNRAVHIMHTSLPQSHEKYWDWSLDELGKFDFPAMINYVCEFTRKPKLIYVGHSQGNAQAFVGLHCKPEVANRLHLFVALAPAFYINDMRHWSLKALVNCPEWLFNFLFGNKSFIPIMNLIQSTFPASWFTVCAYNMFCFLFNWDHSKWIKWRKAKYFQFTPRPLSSKLVLHWTKIIRKGKLCSFSADPQSSEEYSVANIKCPVAIVDGASDSLVDGEKLRNDILANKVKMSHFERIPGFEHMDLIWSKDSRVTVFQNLLKLFENCRD